MIGPLLHAGKSKILAVTAALIAFTAVIDFMVGRSVSLAALYILPMMLAAVVLRPAETAGLAVFCSWLRSWFDAPGSPAELTLRFIFAAFAYYLSALFVTELLRNHELTIRHLERLQTEQSFRRNAEDQLRFLVKSSPAAILTMDERGTVLAANEAANNLLMAPAEGNLEGRDIGEYLPVLSEVLKTQLRRDGLRTAAQCQGRKENGEIFAAHTWFSSYSSPEGIHLAAIVVDSSEELRQREEQALREQLRGNRIIAAAFSHEVRNFCAAMRLLCANVQETHGLTRDPDLQAMANLLAGVETVASLQLQSKPTDLPDHTALREVLDNLRIVVESDWREIGGTVEWRVPADLPSVLADGHGLLQCFMNLAQNSHRSVQEVSDRRLRIQVTTDANRVQIGFHDSGPGVSTPERLFQAFQQGAAGSGLGLYVSRSIVRSYGGDLRYEASSSGGATFVVELQAVS